MEQAMENHCGFCQLKDIAIASTSLVDNHVVYHIKVSPSVEYSWIVKRRYREFCELHDTLSSKFQIKENIFPPKKYVGNLNPEHIERRRVSLEAYLQHVLSHFGKIPRVLQEFLEFHYYDIFAVTQTLAENLFKTGDSLLIKDKPFVLTPLQLHCISQRLKLPIPTCDSDGYCHDVGNLYDIVYCIKHVKIVGDENHDLVGLSNDEISFDLTLFKNIEILEIVNCNIEAMQGTYYLQEHIKKVSVHFSIHLLKDMLIDQDVWTANTDIASFSVSDASQTSLAQECSAMVWKNLATLDVSRNFIPYIDESVTLLQKIEKLDLSFNEIEEIEHLQDLPHLVELDLSHNKIESLEKVNTKLGNIKTLKLSCNRLHTVGGLLKVYSLVNLDLSHNQIDDVANVVGLANLPCLEVLNLLENPVRKKGMYRARLLTAFEERVSQICLDETVASAAEIKDVLQLMTRVDTYEMVDSPSENCHTSVKHRAGQKKAGRRVRVKNQDVLENSLDKVASLPKEEVKTFTEGEQEFKNRVEQIRQLGGDSWLGILNELQNEYKEPSGTKSASLPNQARSTDQRNTAFAGKHVTATLPQNRSQAKQSELACGDVLQFGFSPELEALVNNKMTEGEKLLTGTFITSVEIRENGDEPSMVEEERMVGVDLLKGVLMEIEIDSGRTCAKHKLRDMASVDILETPDAIFVDLLHTQSQTFLRHRDIIGEDVTSCNQGNDHIAKYKMRSLKDAAELFVLLFKFINDSSNRNLMRHHSTESSMSTPSQQPQASNDETSNPIGIPADQLNECLTNVILSQRSSENSELTESSRDVTQPGTEIINLVLWTSCLPYALPEHEFPACLVLTNLNIYLFQVKTDQTIKTQPSLKSSTKVAEFEAKMAFLCCLPLAQLRVVICGLFELGFRLEFSKRGPRGTFTFLTRDSRETESFVRSLREVTSGNTESIDAAQSFQIQYPNEEKLERMKDEIAKSCGRLFKEDERLLMYAFVRDVPDLMTSCSSVDGQLPLTNSTRTLVVTNWRLFLCEEDHVHWPLPSYVKDTPSTPQWVVTKQDDVTRIIGIEVFDVVGETAFIGTSGMSIILEDHGESTSNSAHARKQKAGKTWHVIFKMPEEREQLQRSLSQIWSFHFNGSLQLTKVSPLLAKRLRHSSRVDVPSEFFQQTVPPVVSTTPPSSPLKSRTAKGHRRNASGQYVSKHQDDMIRKSLQVVQKSDAESIKTFFTQKVSQASTAGHDETIMYYTWTGCVAYTHPTREICVWLILTSENVYILADVTDHVTIKAVRDVTFGPGAELCVTWFPLTSLRQVCVGFFDQTFRLETDDPECTFTFITRDYQTTSDFLENLRNILQESFSAEEETVSSSTEPYCTKTGSPSIYDMGANVADGEEATELRLSHGTVRFLYPGDDSIELLRHNIIEFSKNSSDSEISDASILMYLLVFQVLDGQKLSRTFLILDQAVCLCTENHVNFPLPLFEKGLPACSRYHVHQLRPLTQIKRIEFSGFNTQDFTIVFEKKIVNDEPPTSGDGVTKSRDDYVGSVDNAGSVNEIRWTLVAQTYEEKEKTLAMILKFWKESRGEDLPVLKI